jgi:hypothetical protein
VAIDQGESWVNLAGNGKLNPHTGFMTIGEIFFRTSEAALDGNDLHQIEMLSVGIKEYLGAVVGLHRLRSFTFGFIGWADHRGADSYNRTLSASRAEMVKRAFDPHFADDPTWRDYYSSVSIGAGEGSLREAASLHRDRRVDIVSSQTFSQKRPIEFPGTKIDASPDDPDLSKSFAIRTIAGVNFNVPFLEVGAATQLVQIKNNRTGKTIDLTFMGAGGSAGLPIGFNRPTDFENFQTPYYLKLVDFVGEGEISGAAVIQGTNHLMFYGPLLYGRAPKQDILMRKALVIKTTGWDLNVGIGGAKGSWEVPRVPTVPTPGGVKRGTT